MYFQVEKLVLIDASVYAEGTGKMSTLPRVLAYAGVGYLLTLVLSRSEEIVSSLSFCFKGHSVSGLTLTFLHSSRSSC